VRERENLNPEYGRGRRRVREREILTPKGPRPFFCPFLKFGQAIVNAIFVQKI
jgi:hypothetical protein